MDTSVWTIIKRFLAGWMVIGILLVVYSCIKYKEFIVAAFSDHTWACVNAGMPLLIGVCGIGYMLKALFK